jgi:hypothetical protein
MLTHELISSEWNQDYPKYENFSKDFSKLSEITLEIENKYNKYYDFYYQACAELYSLQNKQEQMEKILKLYYSKKPLSDEDIETYKLEPLQVSFTKQEIDMMVRSDERILEIKTKIKIKDLLIERIRGCIKFISDWKWNHSKFIEVYKIKNGII